jgi:hypothetical protein
MIIFALLGFLAWLSMVVTTFALARGAAIADRRAAEHPRRHLRVVK